jgi:DNA-binding ferritin-like protein
MTITRPLKGTNNKESLEGSVANCVTELMNAATTFHKLHLKVRGTGAYAAHKALNELYTALPEHADALAEGFQGACEKLLECSDMIPRKVESVDEAITYIRDLTTMVNNLQSKMPYSEIVNELDTVKDTFNSAKYKLLFLK